MPPDWINAAANGNLLLAAPLEPGATISNGYVGAWLPLSLPGSAGAPTFGVEHIHGVLGASSPKVQETGVRNVGRVSLPSFTLTARIEGARGPDPSTMHPWTATAAALDLKRHAYLVAYRSAMGQGRCETATFAHRYRKHILGTLINCSNTDADGTQHVRLVQDRCNKDDSGKPDQFCPDHKPHEMRIVDVPSGMAGVTCYRAEIVWPETDDEELSRRPVVGHCYETIPAAGTVLEIVPGTQRELVLLSSRASNVDYDESRAELFPASRDPVRVALAELRAAREVGPRELWAEHVRGAADVSDGALVEVEGNLTLARLVNASLYVLNGAQRVGNFYSSAPEGIVSNRYRGNVMWDVETWQWPTWLALWPSVARQTLAYRASRLAEAKSNAALLQRRNDVNRSYGGQAARFPIMSAVVGLEQLAGNTEDHIQADIALAFTQYFSATGDLSWLRATGFPVLAGVARFYCELAEADGFLNGAPQFSIRRTNGPDQYHDNVTNSIFGNFGAQLALRQANTFAALAGVERNETWAMVAEGLRFPYDEERDFHPEFEEYNVSAPNSPPKDTLCNGCSSMVKQADTVMLQYPLGMPMPRSTLMNDLRIYSEHNDPAGPSMTWSIFSIIYKDVGEIDKAAEYFTKSYEAHSRGPFYAWHEGAPTGCTNEPCDSQQAPHFITAAGGFMQAVVNGYAGVRFLTNGSLALMDPQPLPGSTALRIRGLSFRGALLDLEVRRESGWSLSLSLRSPTQAPPLWLFSAATGAPGVLLKRGHTVPMNGSATVAVPDDASVTV